MRAAHRYIMARAIDLLPPELKPFFERNRAELVDDRGRVGVGGTTGAQDRDAETDPERPDAVIGLKNLRM